MHLISVQFIAWMGLVELKNSVSVAMDITDSGTPSSRKFFTVTFYHQ